MKLYNGIVLPDNWPPSDINLESWLPMPVPYLEKKPGIIPVDLGRQLLVDDFLVDRTSMSRVFHQPVKHPANPVFFPETTEEIEPMGPCAISRLGAWHDEKTGTFRMWYHAGYTGALALAESDDGIHWTRPELDVVPGTNLCLPKEIHPDSGTVWIDRQAAREEERYKMMLYKKVRRAPDGTRPPARHIHRGIFMTSPDGIHWSEPGVTGPLGDRSCMFYNPFRKRWVQSIRKSWLQSKTSDRDRILRRCRLYREAESFAASCRWSEGEPVPWTGADCLDEPGDCLPQLYNLDAVAYESIMLGAFEIFRGPENYIAAKSGLPKHTDITLGYSRDGFHWHRPDRRPFIGAERVTGSWEYGYLEPCGGICLVVSDELWFYYSGFAGDPAHNSPMNGMYVNGAMGLARLRRDGFASMRARHGGSTLLTRTLSFTGKHLFVNANTIGGNLKAGVYTPGGEPVEGFREEDCLPFNGNSTRAQLRWRNGKSLAELRERPVCLGFTMDRGDLYAFWISGSESGESGGYTAAGGPGLDGERDE